MKISSAFPSEFIKAADLQGRDVKVVISGVKVKTIGDDTKPVVYFQGKERGLVLNKTNANIIAQAYGDDTDEWIGFEVELYSAMVQYQSNMVEAIRVRIPRVKHAPAATITSGQEQLTAAARQAPAGKHPDMNDDIPFAPEMRG